MESDLDCYESAHDHIHVRNAGIIDELGHVTLVPVSFTHIQTYSLRQDRNNYGEQSPCSCFGDSIA